MSDIVFEILCNFEQICYHFPAHIEHSNTVSYDLLHATSLRLSFHPLCITFIIYLFEYLSTFLLSC